MKYLAHIDKNQRREQTVLEHLTNTAVLSRSFADAFDAGDEGWRCGLLHDIGKYSDVFQKRLKGAAEKPDHSTAGAFEANRLIDLPAAFCIAGHHGGLPDLGDRKLDTSDAPTLFGKLKRRPGEELADYSAFKEELPTFPPAVIPKRFEVDGPSRFFFIKMLYSCLVDADFLDTEAFMSNCSVTRVGYESIQKYGQKLDTYISPFWNAKNELNRLRCDILKELINRGSEQQGLFSLTVPTGGGKTISSMAFALKHALSHSLSRIIYVIPYTSIIEQTQAVFEKIFGVDSVIAHYSTADFGNDTQGELKEKRYLATENWDAPIILTTAVQFFESIYACKSSKCRKLHNIVNSVIIFDEAQMLPVPYLIPCVEAIAQLVKNYGCSAVLCTATQPALNPVLEKLLPRSPIRELCPQNIQENDIFRRVSFCRDSILGNEALAASIGGEKQVLCIVNSRKQAQELFSLMDKDGAFHLSTMMYPEHRRTVLKTIRERLSSGVRCRVVSTSLVEAGVDVDFPTVYRAITGLDSIIQAAGRCNREGKRTAAESVVHIFDTDQKPPHSLEQNIAAARRTLKRFESISSPEAIRDYFEFLLYRLKDEKALDIKSIYKSTEDDSFAFRQVAKRFKIIEGSECTIYIPKGEGFALTGQLLNGLPTRGLMRKLGQYAVGVYENHFKALISSGAAVRVAENAAVLTDTDLYSEETGLGFSAEEGKGVFV